MHYTHWKGEGKFIISPIRDPYHVYRTWYSRGKFGPDFYKEWNRFNSARDSVHILPVDTNDREEHLKNLGEKMGLELKTQWKPIEHMERFEPPEIDLSEVYNLPVVREYYEDRR